MADFSMYGPLENGMRLFQQDQQAQTLNNLNIQRSQVALQQEQQQAQQQQQQAQQEQGAQQRLQQLVQDNNSRSVVDYGEELVKSGFIKQGTDLISKGALAQERLAASQTKQVEATQKRADRSTRLIDSIIPMLEQTHSQDDYNSVVEFAEKTYGQRFPDNVRNARWTPEYKQRLIDLTTAHKDRMQNQAAAQKQANFERQQAVRDRLDQARTAEVDARTQAIKSKQERETKVGGTNRPTAIPKTELKAAYNLMKQDMPEISEDDPAAMNSAYYVAGQARKLAENNRGLDQGTALQQAYVNARQNGIITEKMTEKWYNKMGIGEPTKSMEFKTKPSGGTPAGTPAPAKPAAQAPSSAVSYLKEHPELKASFKAKYGYLPEGL